MHIIIIDACIVVKRTSRIAEVVANFGSIDSVAVAVAAAGGVGGGDAFAADASNCKWPQEEEAAWSEVT